MDMFINVLSEHTKSQSVSKEFREVYGIMKGVLYSVSSTKAALLHWTQKSGIFLILKECILAFLFLLTFIPGFRINSYIEFTSGGREKKT